MVTEYKQKFLFTDLLLAEPDGRALDGLKVKFQNQRKIPSEVAVSVLLSDLHADILSTAVLREKGLLIATDEQVSSAVDVVLKYVTVSEWPVQSRNNLLGRTIRVMREKKDWAAMCKTTEPTTSYAFHPKQITISSMSHMAEAGKIQACTRIYIKETLIPAIYEGPSAMSNVYDMCKISLETYRNVDALEASRAVVDAVNLYIQIFEYVLTVIDDSIGIEYKDPATPRPLHHNCSFLI